MFTILRELEKDLHKIFKAVEANTEQSTDTCKAIILSNGQIPAAIAGLPYKKRPKKSA